MDSNILIPIITAVITGLVTIFGSYLAFRTDSKKNTNEYKVDMESLYSKNIKEIVDFLKEEKEKEKEENEKLREELATIKSNYEQLRIDNEQLKIDMAKLQAQNEELLRQIGILNGTS